MEGAISDGNDQNLWRFIKGLNGTPDTNSPNEVLMHNGRRITSTKGKANCFVDHYAKVSKLKWDNKTEKRTNRKHGDLLKIPLVEEVN